MYTVTYGYHRTCRRDLVNVAQSCRLSRVQQPVGMKRGHSRACLLRPSLCCQTFGRPRFRVWCTININICFFATSLAICTTMQKIYTTLPTSLPSKKLVQSPFYDHTKPQCRFAMLCARYVYITHLFQRNLCGPRVDCVADKYRWTEKIHIACLDEDGEPAKNCAWKVPRHHLTPIWLETMCLKCPMHVKVGCRGHRSLSGITVTVSPAN